MQILAVSYHISYTAGICTRIPYFNTIAIPQVRQEIFDVLGRDRQAKLSDRERLPYTEATIMEIQRLGNVGPRGLPHATCHGPVQEHYSTLSRVSHDDMLYILFHI